ncbi:MAG TPA: ABC transporter substrate-binding protein [Chloroflexota bacterium]|nr:ABC transporter substrate-binding protein [Chloroflexota bacterium]
MTRGGSRTSSLYARAAIALVALITTIAAGCGPTAARAPSGDRGPAQDQRSPKRIAIAMLGEPPAVWDDIKIAGGTVPGIGQFEMLVTAGLAVADEAGTLHPELAEAVPTTENGLWELSPDGRMRVTWKIRDGVRWHDGTPFTSDDLLFTATVGNDTDLAVLREPAYDLIADVSAPDPRTIVVSWSQPYINADRMFSSGSSGFAQPLPRHILERPFNENKEGFLQIPYWNTEFVSTGPFKIRDWQTGSYVTLDAFDQYVLGRPKLDQIEVKFIADPSTLVANVLSGAVDLTFSRAVSIEQGVQVRDQWHDGKIVPNISGTGWTMMYPQLRVPNPAALVEADFRRALIQSIDREQLAESLAAGLGPVADSIIPPDAAEYPAIKDSIVRWPYDTRRATQMIEAMGFAKGADGFYRDPAGQQVSIEIRTTTNEANQKSSFAVADSFQRVGLRSEAVVIPVQRLQDNEYRANYPGLELVNQPDGVDGLDNLLDSSAAPLPERNYRAPNKSRNRGSYVNPDYDAMMDKYLTTVPMGDRMKALGALIHFQTDQQLVMGLFYSVDAIMMTNRLVGVPPASGWNAHTWDVTS